MDKFNDYNVNDEEKRKRDIDKIVQLYNDAYELYYVYKNNNLNGDYINSSSFYENGRIKFDDVLITIIDKDGYDDRVIIDTADCSILCNHSNFEESIISYKDNKKILADGFSNIDLENINNLSNKIKNKRVAISNIKINDLCKPLIFKIIETYNKKKENSPELIITTNINEDYSKDSFNLFDNVNVSIDKIDSNVNGITFENDYVKISTLGSDVVSIECNGKKVDQENWIDIKEIANIIEDMTNKFEYDFEFEDRVL